MSGQPRRPRASRPSAASPSWRGIERDLRADQAEVEALLETWRSWQVTRLATINGIVPSSIARETQAQARQILKKVLVGRSTCCRG
jgi:hypothetical protein